MSTRKKIIIGILVILVLAGVTVTALHFLKKKNVNSKTIDVYSVSEIGQDGSWFGDFSSIGGSVSVNMEQKVYPIKSQKIKAVHVKEGDKVKTGDLIIEYDTTSQNLALETKRTEVELARTNILAAQRELDELKKVVPIEDMPVPEPTTEVPVTETPTTEVPVVDEPVSPEQPADTPEIPLSTDTDALPQDADEDFDNYDQNSNPAYVNIPDVNPANVNIPVDTNNTDNNLDDFNDEITYTREELKKAIADKQNEINSLNTAYQLQQVEYDIMEYQLSSGQVTANFDGVVKTALDEEQALADNTAMIVISGTSGYTVNATIGELSLDRVKLGDTVDLYCYDTGMGYTGTVVDKQLIPATNNYSYSEKLETFYPITINIEDADGLERGMYMEITLPSNNTDSMGSMYLPLAFVMRENDNYYVMKEENGKLKKAYVETGKIMWGELIEVKRGVSYGDYIAFPYASGVEEGLKTNHATADSLYY